MIHNSTNSYRGSDVKVSYAIIVILAILQYHTSLRMVVFCALNIMSECIKNVYKTLIKWR